MKPQQSIIIQLVNLDGSPLGMEAVYCRLNLYTHGTFRYCFKFGPTRNDGKLQITFEEVETERKAEGKIWLMDYNDPLTDCDSRVRLNIPSGDEMVASHNAITKFYNGATPEHAKPWLTANNAKIKAEDVFVELHDGENLVKLPCAMLTS
jgi:hypothetical protein